MRMYSISTAAFRGHDLDPALEAIAAAGFQCIEFNGYGHGVEDWQFGGTDDPPRPPSDKAATKLRRRIESHGLQVTTLHAPPRTNVLGPPTESWRKAKVAVLADQLQFAAALGAAGMVIHGIPNPLFLPKDQTIEAMSPKMIDAMRQSVQELIPVSERTGVRMLLENLPYAITVGKPYPLIAMNQLRPFVDDLPPDQVGLIVDTGHAWTDGHDPVAEIKTAGTRLWGTHLQDVDAKNPNDNHWIPTHGGLDWPAICTALNHIHYQGIWTFEVINGRQGETVHELARKTYEVAMSWEV